MRTTDRKGADFFYNADHRLPNLATQSVDIKRKAE